MANINLVTANKVEVVKSWQQVTMPRAEAITAGAPVRQDTTSGKATNAKATSVAEATVLGIAVQGTDPTTVTIVKEGILDGYDLSGLDYDDPVYLSDTDGRLADAAGTVAIRVGRVIGGFATTLGTAADKLLLVDIESDAAQSPTVSTMAVSDADGLSVNGEKVATHIHVIAELLAASVDKWVFIADRAYTVVQVEEIHSVVGGSGAVVRPRKITDVQTPGAAAGATVKELTSANIDLTTTVNTVQTPALSATASDLDLADGDKIALDFGGTLTGLVGLIDITLKLK